MTENAISVAFIIAIAAVIIAITAAVTYMHPSQRNCQAMCGERAAKFTDYPAGNNVNPSVCECVGGQP